MRSAAEAPAAQDGTRCLRQAYLLMQQYLRSAAGVCSGTRQILTSFLRQLLPCIVWHAEDPQCPLDVCLTQQCCGRLWHSCIWAQHLLKPFCVSHDGIVLKLKLEHAAAGGISDQPAGVLNPVLAAPAACMGSADQRAARVGGGENTQCTLHVAGIYLWQQ